MPVLEDDPGVMMLAGIGSLARVEPADALEWPRPRTERRLPLRQRAPKQSIAAQPAMPRVLRLHQRQGVTQEPQHQSGLGG